MLFPVDTTSSLKESSFIMTSFGALRSFPSRIMMESPFIFKASNHSRTLFPSAKLMTHVQLGFPGRVNNWGDDVIIPCGSVSRHPHEHEAPDSVRKRNFQSNEFSSSTNKHAGILGNATSVKGNDRKQRQDV